MPCSLRCTTRPTRPTPITAGPRAWGGLLDEAFARAERIPDLVLTAHVHNYQRFMRALEGRQLPYLVAGAGGYWHLHNMAKAADGSKLQTPWAVPDSDVTLEAYADDRHGFLRLTVTKDALAGEYTTVPRPQESWSNGPVDVVDSFVVDLASHTVATGSNRA